MSTNLRRSSLVTIGLTMVTMVALLAACFGFFYAVGVPSTKLLIPAIGATAVLGFLVWLNVRARDQWLSALHHDAQLLAHMVGRRRTGLHLGTELYTEELRPLSKLVQQERQKLLVLGLTDPLCDVGNRRALEHWLRRLFDRPDTRVPVSVLLIDLDHFKEINDQYGHDIGDQVIKRFVAALKHRVREFDLIGRMGGDEFCVVFPQTRLPIAMSLASRLRAQLPSTVEVKQGVYHTLAWTGGLSVTDVVDRDYKQVLKRADLALLKAKGQGRNQTKIYERHGLGPTVAESVLH